MRNDTAFPHGIHLHGHHFHEFREDSSPGQYRDPKDERRPDRGLPDEAQHLGGSHAGGLARHGGALEGEADPRRPQ